MAEEIDQDFEPSDDEIDEYCEFIGIDYETYPELKYLAKKALTEPLD